MPGHASRDTERFHFDGLLRGWPRLVLVGFLGGVLAFGFSLLKQPLYEAEAVLGIGINYGITEPLELVVEDRVLGRVRALLLADQTLAALLEQIPEEVRSPRGWHDPAGLRDSLRVDQRLGDWGLVVADPDPEVARQAAQAWAEIALQTLDQAVAHGWKAVGLMAGPFDVDCVPVYLGGIETWDCQLTEIAVGPQALAGALQSEAALSRGILPILSYELLRSAEAGGAPVLWDRGPMIAAGTVIGFTLGLIWAAVRSSRQEPLVTD